ncbi:MAG TPA: glycosyltransferase [Anaeromyxobacter sp.]|nr:glycosyltransferase [Anaeromyxobacter sp.]
MARALRDIVCFSNDWDGDPLSKTHLMRILSRDARVLWVDSLGNRSASASANDAARIAKKLRAAARGVVEVEPNLHVLSPLYVPALGSALAARANRVLVRLQMLAAMRHLGMRRPVSWCFLPSAEAVAGTLGEELVVYHVVDDFSAFSDASQAVPEMERRLVARSDLVVASSEKLFEEKRRENPNTVLVRHGVDWTHFARACEPGPIPDDLARLPKPVIGFFGQVADWIDLELVRRVADAYPRASLVLLGKVVTSTAALAGARNVFLLGRKRYADLPAYCRGFTVALTPFRKNALALAANPLKAREYVAAGLPNVCTDIPELRVIPGCTVAPDDDAFVAEVGRALASGGPDPARSALVRGEGWEAKAAEIVRHIEAALARPRGVAARRLVRA